ALLAGNLAEGRGVEPARLQEYYLTLQRDANRLQRLVADVLDVSRLERNSFRVEPQPTDPAALLRQAAAEHAPRLADAGLELRLALSEPLPETALDPGAVERALANLLENARKYASDGGVVELRAEADDQELRVVVEDRGPGIPAALRERVFRPFERGPAENGLAAGAGLGLALVRETLLAHGGSVELAGGADGAGARFTLRFPLANLPATDR
nr:HAMP domain-containing histidine kinase [Planctomycetota bacterium]